MQDMIGVEVERLVQSQIDLVCIVGLLCHVCTTERTANILPYSQGEGTAYCFLQPDEDVFRVQMTLQSTFFPIDILSLERNMRTYQSLNTLISQVGRSH